MRSVAMFGMLVVLAVASRGRQEDSTPRATDLLRAKRLAERNAERLQLPAFDAPGWLRGGTGWGEEPAGSARPRHRAKAK